MAPLLGAIADDATGATDLCSVLARGGMRTVQTVGVARDVALPDVDAVVVALKSRTVPAAEAVASSLEALEWLRELGARQIFFKYCSTFDSTPAGNIGPVADALLDALGAELTVVCPAYPANERTLYNGHLFVGDRLLSESSMVDHPLTPMTDPDIVRVLARQTSLPVRLVAHEVVRGGAGAVEERLAELRAEGVAYAVTDALTEDDVLAIGSACAELPLVTGGAGVATGLPGNFRRRGLLLSAAGPAEVELPDGPAVVLAGSVSAATREQGRRLAARYPAVEVDVLDPDVDRVERAVREALGAGAVLVRTAASLDDVVRAQERLGVKRAAEAAEGVLAELARRLARDGVRRIVVAGGETSGAVVSALGVRALLVGREIAAGVPWMVSVGGPPLALALKSGNFGGPDFFLDALEGSPGE